MFIEFMARGGWVPGIGTVLTLIATSRLGLAAQVAGDLDSPSNRCLDYIAGTDSTSFLQVGLTAGNALLHVVSGGRQTAEILEEAFLGMFAANNPYTPQDKNGTMCNIMAPLWRQAASILGVSKLFGADDECSFIDRFYWSRHERHTYSSNYIRSYKLDNFHLTYIPQWKCGNDNIRDNLRRLGVPEAELANVAAGTSEQNFAADAWHSVHDWVPDNASFSIVREPMSRFVSGYNEIEFRIAKFELCNRDHTGMGATCSEALQLGSEKYDNVKPLTTERALEFIKDILGYRLSPMILYEHVFSMLGNLNAYQKNYERRITFVGRLEHFAAAWERMQTAGKLKFPKFKNDLGSHGSSEYPAGSYMREVLGTNKNARLAMACAVLLPDQLCFEYAPMVDIASECTSVGFASSEGWARLVGDIRKHMCPDIRELQPLDA